MALRAQPLKMGMHQITGVENGVDPNDAVNKSQLDAAIATAGTVTSVAVSGGTTGLTTSGGPITTSGTITMAGTLIVANGGTGLATLTANNVILGAGTSTPTFVAPGTSGNVLTSNGTTWTSAAAPATWTRVFSTADQSFSSGNTGATLTNLTSLSFSIAANANYAFKATLFIEAGTTGGIKVGITNPSSPSTFTAAGFAAGNSAVSNVIAANAISGGTQIFGTSGAGWALAVIQIYGRIYNGANAGSVTFQGAQLTSNGTNTTFQKGSFIEYSLIS